MIVFCCPKMINERSETELTWNNVKKIAGRVVAVIVPVAMQFLWYLLILKWLSKAAGLLIICVPIFRIIGEAVIMLTVDDLQKLTVGIDDAPDFGRLPVNIHLKWIMLDVRHVLGELLLHDTVLVVFRNKEQISDILPIQPIVKQMRALVDIFIDESCKLLHILL